MQTNRLKARIIIALVMLAFGWRAFRIVVHSVWSDLKFTRNPARIWRDAKMVWTLCMMSQQHEGSAMLRTSCRDCGIETRGHEQCDECRFGDLAY